MKKFLLSILFGFSVITFSSAKSISSKDKQATFNPKGRETSRKHDALSSFLNQVRESKELKAQGVVVTFQRLPNAKQQKEIIRRLKTNGLKKTKSIQSFKAWLFEWSEGGSKPSNFGERACEELKDLLIIKKCSPDHLLPLNRSSGFLKPSLSYLKYSNPSVLRTATIGKDENTEAGFIEYCVSCLEKTNHPLSELPSLPSNIRTCNLVPHEQQLMDGKLSDYWAQELIGSDLLREELDKVPHPLIPNWIMVFDRQIEDHSIRVMKLISDNGPQAVLPTMEVDTVIPYMTNFVTDDMSVVDHIQKHKLPLHFINKSLGWAESELVLEALQRLSPPAIVITSAGNVFPRKLENMKRIASEKFDAINVGSFSPKGFVSKFSVSGEQVHILAPSDNWLGSADENGEYRKFDKTSGAGPLVTGSLAGFEWLSDYHPTAEEAKILLEKTAFPTLHSHENPQINGAGLVNAYKLGEVGKRLKEKCRNKKPSCFKDWILNEENYYFDLEKLDKNLKNDLNQAFPSCAIGEKPVNHLADSNCEEKGEVFKRVRKAVLLNPEESKEFLKSLSCVYKEGGFSQNAKAIDKLALALGSQEDVRASIRALAKEEEPISDEMLRLMLGLGGFEEEFKLFENAKAVRIAGGIGESALPLVKKAFNTDVVNDDDFNETRFQALIAAARIGMPALPFLEETIENEMDSILADEEKLKAAGYLFAESPVNLTMEFLSEAVAFSIGKPALPLLKRLSKDKRLSREVRRKIKRMMREIKLKPFYEKKEEMIWKIKQMFNGNQIR